MNNKTHTLCLMAMMLVFATALQAQISGTVLEEASGEPIIGASILQVGTTNGVITDFDGNFELNVPEGTQLQFSYMGFQTQTLPAQRSLQRFIRADSSARIYKGTRRRRDTRTQLRHAARQV